MLVSIPLVPCVLGLTLCCAVFSLVFFSQKPHVKTAHTPISRHFTRRSKTLRIAKKKKKGGWETVGRMEELGTGRHKVRIKAKAFISGHESSL